MKILHLNDHYEKIGGAEILLFRTLEALENVGIENVVVHQHPAPADRRRAYCVPGLGEAGIRANPAILDAVRRIVEKEGPDLIHAHDIGNPDVVELSSRLRPTVQSVLNHSFYCPGGMKYLPGRSRVCERAFGPGCLTSALLTHCNSIRPTVLIRSYRRSQRMTRNPAQLFFLTLSHYQAKQLEEAGVPPDRIRVLPPFTPLPPLASNSLADSPFILFTGRIYPGKGLPLLIRALQQIRSPCRLVVDGEGPGLEPARQLAQKLGLSDRVEFAGWTKPDRHEAFYRRCALVVLPSVWPEPFGLVGIEAMSYSKSVVAFRVGAVPEWLKDSVYGFLIRPYDIDAMADRIDELLKDPALRLQMGTAGREWVSTQFSEEKFLSRLLEIYREAQAASP